jgi:hypothetical protein
MLDVRCVVALLMQSLMPQSVLHCAGCAANKLATMLHLYTPPFVPLCQRIQENSVGLSTMKASKFFVVFEADITYWEKTLSHISETVEMILQVGMA